MLDALHAALDLLHKPTVKESLKKKWGLLGRYLDVTKPGAPDQKGVKKALYNVGRFGLPPAAVYGVGAHQGWWSPPTPPDVTQGGYQVPLMRSGKKMKMIDVPPIYDPPTGG